MFILSEFGMFFIIPMAVSFGVYFLILKGINKFIFKGNKKINFIEFIIGWSIIFVINLVFVLAQIKFAIGIPVRPYLDGGANTYYVSLGYVIYVERPFQFEIGNDPIHKDVVEFYNPFSAIVQYIENSQKAYTPSQNDTEINFEERKSDCNFF